MQPQPLKLTIKLKIDKSSSQPSPTVDDPGNVERESNDSTNYNIPNNPQTNSKDGVDSSSTGIVENHTTQETKQNKSSPNQLVVYDPVVNGFQDSIRPQPSRPHRVANQSTHGLSSVGVFTVQCSNCFKWRVVPTKEKYEEIREHITEHPFLCETGREWRAQISCDDPPDITQDGSRVWAIDKPNIAQPPPGWQRLLRIRGEGGSKFADVYYISPSGKRLRSMVEVQRYLNLHPEYIKDGVKLSRFSFQTPKPLHENYVRKRPAEDALNVDASANVISQAQPISWVCPEVDTDLQISRPGSLTGEVKSGEKKGLRRRLSKGSCNTDSGNIYSHGGVDV